RYGAICMTLSLGLSPFDGRTPLFAQALIDVTGNSYMPAFYIMFFSVIAFIAVCCIKESARRPLLGPFPTVETREEALELVAGQDANPALHPDTMPNPVLPGPL